MKKKRPKPKILVVVGPTAVGKTALSIKLAKRNNGEIISADSRQVYQNLNIGTEKITKKEMASIPHHLLDVANPRRALSVAQYKQLAEQAIQEIIKRNRLPIIVGGTGFYIDAIVYNRLYPSVPPQQKLRDSLEKKTAKQLHTMLTKLDPRRAKTIEKENKRRLIRAIEIATVLGKVPRFKDGKNKYDVLQIGLAVSDNTLRKRIHARLAKAIRKGLVAETKKLKKGGLSWKRINELGLEYRTSGMYIRGEITKQEMTRKMQSELWQYAKRQTRWFKRDDNIQWFDPKQYKKIENNISKFLHV
ncbi:MAG TPA: tRNA (adenosine(37)-N6)-dimethylallyltransferase MiaA [Candidatus Paceibacterota bacterium]